MKRLSYIPFLLFLTLIVSSKGQQTPDYFTVHAGELPVKVFYGLKPQPMSLLGLDPTKGVIYCKQGGGRVQLELRGLDRQNVKGFVHEWPQAEGRVMRALSNEQYQNPDILNAVRPTIYKLMRYLEIPNSYFPIHGDCLTYVKALVGMEQFDEAFYVLARINLAKLDEFGFREFSEASLDLAGKMIIANPKSAKTARALLQRVQIRNDSGDHASYLKLANSLREKGLFNEAISEYARLSPIVSKTLNSPHQTVLELWPVYCYIKLYETYIAYAARDKRYAQAANKMFNTALEALKKIDEEPPSRQTNEYSLYKLIRSLVRIQYARQFETAGDADKSAEYYRQSVLEVTEGIVNARVGLEWLPESLMMAADAYEKLELHDAARNVYKQVKIFYKSTKWEKASDDRMAKLPPPA
jgi:tetratricopeptide (TPR) repeat protein